MEYLVMLNYNNKEKGDFYHNLKINKYLHFANKIIMNKNIKKYHGLIAIKYLLEHNL